MARLWVEPRDHWIFAILTRSRAAQDGPQGSHGRTSITTFPNH
jgi:hypothetical protein